MSKARHGVSPREKLRKAVRGPCTSIFTIGLSYAHLDILMMDKTILITGASSGIGKVAAQALARQGATLVIHGRDAHKLEGLKEEIVRDFPDAKVDTLIADLCEPDQIRRMVGAFDAKYGQLDVLVNNAGGVMDKQRQTNALGWERTIALNVLAPFLLSALLYPKLRSSGQGRIVNVSSMAHRGAKADLSDFMYERHYSPLRAYSDAKLYVLLLGKEFLRRQSSLGESGVTMNAFHPGVVATNFARQSNSLYHYFFRIFRPLLIGPEKGADTLLYLASSEQAGRYNGAYFYKRRPAPIRFDAGRIEETARLVWEKCQLYTGTEFL